MSVIPKIPRASGGGEALPPWAPYQGSTLCQLGILSGPQTPRLLTPPLTTNPGSAPGNNPLYNPYPGGRFRLSFILTGFSSFVNYILPPPLILVLKKILLHF